MGKRSRDKGAQWERDVAKLFAAALPGVDCRRTGYMQVDDGAFMPDVYTGGIFHIECKVGKLPNPRAALAQAAQASKGYAIPIAVIKDDRRAPFVTLSLMDFLGIVDWPELISGSWRTGDKP